MKELSLHILDIVQNSIRAKASLIQIEVIESRIKDILIIKIEDNGFGMSKELEERVTDPFLTTRTTRKVGLGIPFFKLAAEQSNGSFQISSFEGSGTVVTARFQHSHIDRSPIGDMAATFQGFLSSNDDIDFIYTHITDNGKFQFDTREAKKILNGVSLSTFEILQWITEYINQGLEEIEAEKF